LGKRPRQVNTYFPRRRARIRSCRCPRALVPSPDISP
jgi:hypothetical protein